MPEDGNEDPSPNDQRSDVKNPNNPAHKANRDNRADQFNPNNDATKDADHPDSQGQPQGGDASEEEG